MTLQQLKYMITVAEKGSITEAAKELFISQPSLSGAIKEDVRNRFSDLGVLYLSRANENVLVKVFEEYNLKFVSIPSMFTILALPIFAISSSLLYSLLPKATSIPLRSSIRLQRLSFMVLCVAS